MPPENISHWPTGRSISADDVLPGRYEDGVIGSGFGPRTRALCSRFRVCGEVWYRDLKTVVAVEGLTLNMAHRDRGLTCRLVQHRMFSAISDIIVMARNDELDNFLDSITSRS